MSEMRRKKIVFGFIVLVFVISLAGCGLGVSRSVEVLGEASADTPARLPAEPMPTIVLDERMAKAWNGAAPGEAAQGASEALAESPAAPLPVGSAPLSVPRYDRKIIKSSEMTLQVTDTDVAIDQLTGIAADYDGYIVSSRAWSDGTYRMATVTISVPVDNFEQVLRRLRGMAIKVLDERADGQDVTEQYVDLESRLRNLEATQTRIRAFLDQAVTVEEALEVNRRLSDIEGQIEEVKGKMNYIKERAVYSTITVQLQPERPTPTPSPTPTLPAWKPVETFNEASGALTVLLRFFGDVVIWLAVIVLPFLIPLALIVWALIAWSKRRAQNKRERSQSQ